MASRQGADLEQETTTLRTVLISVALAVAGGLLMWWSVSAGKHPTLAALLGQFGGVLMATGLLTALWELVGRRAFAREVLAKAKLSADVANSGVTRITDQYLGDVEWADLFEGTTKLDVVVAYAATWRNTHWKSLQAVAARKSSSIRVFLPDPEDADTMGNLGRRFGKEPEAVQAAVREAIAEFSKLAVADGGSVEVYVRPGDVVFSCYRFDTRAVLTLYSHARSRQTSVPTFVMASGDLYKFVRNEVDAIAEQSRRV